MCLRLRYCERHGYRHFAYSQTELWCCSSIAHCHCVVCGFNSLFDRCRTISCVYFFFRCFRTYAPHCQYASWCLALKHGILIHERSEEKTHNKSLCGCILLLVAMANIRTMPQSMMRKKKGQIFRNRGFTRAESGMTEAKK